MTTTGRHRYTTGRLHCGDSRDTPQAAGTGRVRRPGRPFIAVLLALGLGACSSHWGMRVPDEAPVDATSMSPPQPALELITLDAPALRETAEPEPPTDLWDRLRAGFLLPDIEHARIDAQIARYTRHPDYLSRVASRAELYLYHIVTELERRDLPLELALLPIVESAYDPYAYSHGRAAGLWQFIPGTARMYGLEQDWWHDQRRDVKESTRAALDFLEDLAQAFDGDWMLALAGYNAGPGNVRRALRRNRDRGLPEDFFALPLPAETRAYVPKLLALRQLIADPEAFDLLLPEIPNEPHFAVVPIGGQLDLAQAADLAGLDSRELYLLNPALNRWATHPQGPHRLLVPKSQAEALASGIANLDPAERVAWHRHTIRPGESLSTIARHHQTDVATLRMVNDISGNTIRAGDALLIPQASAGSEAYALSQDQRAAARDTRFGRDESRDEFRYRVQPGDSFWTIARAHGVSVNQVARWNGMAPRDPLRAGRELVLWLPGAANQQRADASGVCADGGCTLPQRQEEVRRVSYRVRNGDSLARIASRFGVSVAEISEWNQLNPARYLQPGQQLLLHVPVTGGR